LHSRIDIGSYEKHISTIIVSDTIKRDTTWIADTVKVMSDLVIADDQTLTITPGTIVKFMGYFKIEVKGTLIAHGTEQDTIVFTVADTSGFSNDTVSNGGWFGIRIDGFDGKMLDNDTTELKWCHIRYAKAYDYSEDVFNSFGGGIHVSYFSRMIVDQCYLETNYARRGGAIYLTHADIKIRNSTCKNNRAELTGGGIHSANSNPIIFNNKFLNNYCQPGGGGMAIDHSNPIIQKNVIFNNESTGILCEQSNLSIFNNLICNNWGSGIDARASSAEITGNIITNNNGGDGGAINFWDSEDIMIYNNTLCNNLAGRGGGISVHNSHIKLFNNILFDNRANVGSQIWVWDKYSTLALYNNNIEGDSAAIVFQEGSPEYAGYMENIDMNPAFSNPTEGAGQEFNGWLADWSLLPVSPCINKGNKDFYTTGIPTSD